MRRFLIGWLSGSALASLLVAAWVAFVSFMIAGLFVPTNAESQLESPGFEAALRVLAGLPLITLLVGLSLLPAFLLAAAVSHAWPPLRHVAYSVAGAGALLTAQVVWSAGWPTLEMTLLFLFIGALAGLLAGWISRPRAARPAAS
jgi:hypothetical protein